MALVIPVWDDHFASCVKGLTFLMPLSIGAQQLVRRSGGRGAYGHQRAIFELARCDSSAPSTYQNPVPPTPN